MHGSRIPRLVLTAFLALVVFGVAFEAPAADRRLGEFAFAAGDYRTALREWQPLAESGDTVAQYKIGMLYARGLGVTRDPKSAAKWYRQAADSGQADAQFEIGNLHLYGYFDGPNQKEARTWYQLAADQDHQMAMNRLEQIDAQKQTATGVEIADEPLTQVAAMTVPDASTLIESSGRCPAVERRDYSVDVVLEMPRAPIDHGRSLSDLNNGGPHGPGMVIGLAVPDMELSTSGQYGYQINGDSKCFWVEHVEARVVYRSMKIFIASEYKKGTCPYAQILKHEREHVNIARINLNRFKPRIRAALSSLSIPKPGQPVRIGKNADPREKMSQLFRKLVEPVIQDMMEDLEASQAKIDTPESYDQLNRRCRSW